MIQNEIGMWYQLIASVVGILIGITALFFTSKLVNAQVRFASKFKDPLNQKIANELRRPYILTLGKIIGLILIVGCLFQFVSIIMSV